VPMARATVATANAGANPRYFGHGRGLTWLNYLNDQVSGLGAVVVPGTVRDSLHILDGLLDLDGGQHPEMIATNTASYSDQVFGLFTLLGYRFSPAWPGRRTNGSGASAPPRTTDG
jgi:TnpA family transposase